MITDFLLGIGLLAWALVALGIGLITWGIISFAKEKANSQGGGAKIGPLAIKLLLGLLCLSPGIIGLVLQGITTAGTGGLETIANQVK
jgi:hypothetical protein